MSTIYLITLLVAVSTATSNGAPSFDENEKHEERGKLTREDFDNGHKIDITKEIPKGENPLKYNIEHGNANYQGDMMLTKEKLAMMSGDNTDRKITYSEISSTHFCWDRRGGRHAMCNKYGVTDSGCRTLCTERKSCLGYSYGFNTCYLVVSSPSCLGDEQFSPGQYVTSMQGFTVLGDSGYSCHVKVTAGWYDAGEDKSCTDFCASRGLTCTREQFFKHNYEIDSSEKVLALIGSVGGSTTAGGCNPFHSSYTAVPLWNANTCYASTPSRKESTFSCTKKPNPLKQGKHRLCYCHTKGYGPCRDAADGVTIPDTEDTESFIKCSWANAFWCKYEWFYTVCIKSCGTCLPSAEGCGDVYPSCQTWALSGDCTNDPWVLKNCRRSCGVCE